MRSGTPSKTDNAAYKQGWYVVDHERDDAVMRGPYEESTTAGAVRTEMERDSRHDHRNLWIVSHHYLNGDDDE